MDKFTAGQAGLDARAVDNPVDKFTAVITCDRAAGRAGGLAGWLVGGRHGGLSNLGGWASVPA